MNVDLALTSWDVLPSHRLALVVTTHDRLFADFAAPGETVDIMPGSYIDIPYNDIIYAD